MRVKMAVAAAAMCLASVGMAAPASAAEPSSPPPHPAGVAVWHDAHGWHVRVTHKTLKDKVFSGTVATRATITAVTSVRLERNDYVKTGAGRHGIAFRFNNYGGIDGFDFQAPCGQAIEFGFTADGHRVPVGKIVLNARGRHPAHNPFLTKC
jgi:hypothetical protein